MRNARVNSPSGEVRLLATDANLEEFVERQSFKEGDPARVWRELQAGDSIAVSEPFAYRNGKGVGSTVRLSTSEGDRDFRVAGIYYDYGSTGTGRVMMSRAVYTSIVGRRQVFRRGGRCGGGSAGERSHRLSPGCDWSRAGRDHPLQRRIEGRGAGGVREEFHDNLSCAGVGGRGGVRRRSWGRSWLFSWNAPWNSGRCA